MILVGKVVISTVLISSLLYYFEKPRNFESRIYFLKKIKRSGEPLYKKKKKKKKKDQTNKDILMRKENIIYPFDPDGSHMLVSEIKPCKCK